MEKLTGAKPLYELCGAIVLNANRNGMFENVEKYNSGEKKLTPEEYELLGSIAFFHGLQFTTQRNSFTKKTMENFQMRMNAHKIDLEFQEKIRNFIEAVDVSIIVDGNEVMKNLIISTITADSEHVRYIQNSFKSIVEFAVFDISLSEQVFSLANKKELTYSDILMMNKLIFDDFDLVTDSIEYIDKLYANETFRSELVTASKHYDSTKFSFVFLDSIITLKEWFAEFPLLSDTYIDVDTETIVDLENVEDFSMLKNADEIIKPKETIIVDPKLTDEFLRSVLMESKQGVDLNALENADQLFVAINDVLNNEDLLPSVYKFLHASLNVNRTNLNEVYGFDISVFIEMVNKVYLGLRKDITEITIDFLNEIDIDKHEELIDLVDGTIRAIIMNGSEKKGYLMNQLDSNQIQTINHLHQILGLIETCNIVGGRGYENYVGLLSYIEERTPEIKNIFNKIENTERIKMEINYYKAVLDFFNQKSVK
jgi:hypothetical protein